MIIVAKRTHSSAAAAVFDFRDTILETLQLCPENIAPVPSERETTATMFHDTQHSRVNNWYWETDSMR